MNKRAEGWALPSIFGIVGLFLMFVAFNGCGFWCGFFGIILIIVAIILYLAK